MSHLHAVTETREAFADHPTFCRESLQIRDKNGIPVAFNLQPAQIKLNDAVKKCVQRGRPIRIIFLKARQVMVSAGTAAQFFHRVPFRTGQKALIVAHESKASKNLFNYYKQLHDSYKPFRGMASLPELKKDASAAGMIEYENDSYVHVSTANNLKSGRSYSLRYLHLSEYAFWANAKTLMTGLMQAVPDDPDTMVVIESTANGVGGDFHKRWMEACDPNSESEWIPIFFAWWEHPEYVRTVADPAEFQASLTQDERELMSRFSLRLEQMNWRRWKIRTACGGSIDSFKQEFPAFPEEAFLFSGRPRFDHKALSRMPIKQDGLVGELFRYEDYGGVKKPLVFTPNEDGKGACTVYRKPSPNKRYVFGVDVAEGIDLGEGVVGAEDTDYSVCNVLDGGHRGASGQDPRSHRSSGLCGVCGCPGRVVQLGLHRPRDQQPRTRLPRRAVT